MDSEIYYLRAFYRDWVKCGKTSIKFQQEHPRFLHLIESNFMIFINKRVGQRLNLHYFSYPIKCTVNPKSCCNKSKLAWNLWSLISLIKLIAKQFLRRFFAIWKSNYWRWKPNVFSKWIHCPTSDWFARVNEIRWAYFFLLRMYHQFTFTHFFHWRQKGHHIWVGLGGQKFEELWYRRWRCDWSFWSWWPMIKWLEDKLLIKLIKFN